MNVFTDLLIWEMIKNKLFSSKKEHNKLTYLDIGIVFQSFEKL